MGNRKIGKWEYHYLTSEDFACESVYSEIITSDLWKLILSNSPKNNLSYKIFRKIIVKAAHIYCCQEYFMGSDSLSYRQINAKIDGIHKSANQLKERLFPTSLEVFEDFVEAVHPREDTEGDYDLQDISHYAQCRINDSIGYPIPTIKKFYENHTGYGQISGLLHRLENDLSVLVEICNSRDFLTKFWEHERNKNMGTQRMALHVYVYNLALLWEYCMDDVATITKDDNGNIKSKCLDFIQEAYTPLQTHYHTMTNTKKARLGRMQLYTCLDKYRQNSFGKRGNRDANTLMKILLENLSLHDIEQPQ